MGTVAAIERGYRADAGLVPEPTLLNLWIATRGLLHGSFVVPGRSAHAEVNQPPWQHGGGVNAIERAVPLLRRWASSATEWARARVQAPPAARPPLRAADDRRRRRVHLQRARRAARSTSTRPTCPGDADAQGYGSDPRGEIVERGRGRAGGDDWLRETRSWTWATDYPPSEIEPGEADRHRARAATAELGVECAAEGIDTTYDGALLTRLAGVPSPAFGPGDLGRAHAPDEWIGDRGAAAGARAYTRAICAWCGVA